MRDNRFDRRRQRLVNVCEGAVRSCATAQLGKEPLDRPVASSNFPCTRSLKRCDAASSLRTRARQLGDHTPRLANISTKVGVGSDARTPPSSSQSIGAARGGIAAEHFEQGRCSLKRECAGGTMPNASARRSARSIDCRARSTSPHANMPARDMQRR